MSWLNWEREEFSLEETAALEDLIGRPPDPIADRDALAALRDPERPDTRHLARQFHRRRVWRATPLRELLPGLDLVESDARLTQLSVRASNRLSSAQVETWSALAGMTAHRIECLPDTGKTTLEEVILFSLAHWAAAFLSADARGERPEEAARFRLASAPLVAEEGRSSRSLLGRDPDPGRDRWLLLALADPSDPAAGRLAAQIRTEGSWTRRALEDLLPGLAQLDPERVFGRLGMRAANGLTRAGIMDLCSLVELSPVEISELPQVGERTIEEILNVLVREWASWCLGEDDAADSEEPAQPSLAAAFAELEATTGFSTFRRRRLDAAQSPSFTALGSEDGVSSERARQLDAKIATLLERRMRTADWPLRTAVDELRAQLGAVARPGELSAAFERIDSGGGALPAEPAHRRALLLWLGRYRVEEEWVLGPEIEELTDVVLGVVADSGPDSLYGALRQLGWLGVRDELQLPWILSRFGFRIIDGELVSTWGAVFT